MDLKTVFIIVITTSKMIMPGMPAMPNLPGMGDFNAPTRTLTMHLESDKKADKNSKAECAIPAGLKLGPKVDLTIDLPQRIDADEIIADEGKEDPSQRDFKIKAYWKCSETVLPGQPKVIDFKDMDKTMREALNSKEAKKEFARAMDNLQNGSHAYWPGKDNRKIAKDATCPGDYTLTTNYCGGTSITFNKPQDFLAPLELVSPGKKIDLEKFIKVEWKKVPNATAYLISAFSSTDKEMITWTSSSDPNLPANLQYSALSKADVEKYIKNGILLPADATSCYIPAGIFKNADVPMLTVTAFGVDKIQSKDGIATHVIVRSNATVMLGGMDMGDYEEIDEPEIDEVSDETADETSSDNPKPTVKNDESSDDGDALDKTNESLDDVDKAKNTVDRIKGIFKW